MSEATPDSKSTASGAQGLHDADVLAAYRAANRATGAPAHDKAVPDATGRAESDAQSDAPRPETRSAILAAAARAVHARPVAVGTGGSSVRNSGAARFRYRTPLALAASLLVGTVAWQLAAQFDDAPVSVEQVASAPPAAAPAPMTAPTSSPSAADDAAPAPPPPLRSALPSVSAAGKVGTPAGQTAASADKSATPERERNAVRSAPGDAAARRDAQAVPVPAESAAGASAPGVTTPAPDAKAVAEATARVDAQMRAARTEAPASLVPPGPVPVNAATAGMAATAPGRPAAAPVSAESTAPTEPAAPRASERTEARSQPRADAAASTPKEELVRTQPVDRRLFSEEPPPRPLPAWLERIAELRRMGRDAEAEAELQALRRAYPQAEIPPALLKPMSR